MSDQGWASANRRERASILLPSSDRTEKTRDNRRSTTTGLVELAREGDKDAFGTLYKEHHAAIYRLARFHLPGAAEDLVAETFLRAWKALPRYRDTGAPFVAWLYGIARHVVVDEIRRRKRTELRDWIDEEGHSESPDDRLLIAGALRQLPDEQRKVIEMKYLLGLRNPEVARLLGKTVGAVNAMQWRALQSLRSLLEDHR